MGIALESQADLSQRFLQAQEFSDAQILRESFLDIDVAITEGERHGMKRAILPKLMTIVIAPAAEEGIWKGFNPRGEMAENLSEFSGPVHGLLCDSSQLFAERSQNGMSNRSHEGLKLARSERPVLHERNGSDFNDLHFVTWDPSFVTTSRLYINGEIGQVSLSISDSQSIMYM